MKPAQPLRVKDVNSPGRCRLCTAMQADKSVSVDKGLIPRISNSELASLSRPTLDTTSFAGEKAVTSEQRESVVSFTSATTAPKTKEEAVLKAMRSLEGLRHLVQMEKGKNIQHDVLATIKRPAPSPPQPESASPIHEKRQEIDEKKVDDRRSLGHGRAAGVEITVSPPGKADSERRDLWAYQELTRAVVVSVHQPALVEIKTAPISLEPESELFLQVHLKDADIHPVGAVTKTVLNVDETHASLTEASPARPRQAVRPTTLLVEGQALPGEDFASPLAELRDKILSSDRALLISSSEMVLMLGQRRSSFASGNCPEI